MDKANDVHYMKKYLETALKLEQYRYSIVQSKKYALHEKAAAEQQANTLEKQYLEKGINLAGADENDYIDSQRKAIGSVVPMAIWCFIFSALAIGFIALEIAVKISGKTAHGTLLEMSIIPIGLAILFFILAQSRKKGKSKNVLSAQLKQKYQQATEEWNSLGEETEPRRSNGCPGKGAV